MIDRFDDEEPPQEELPAWVWDDLASVPLPADLQRDELPPPPGDAHVPARVAATAKAAADADAAEREAFSRRAVSGAAFILDRPPGVPAVWGIEDRVAWSAGEPVIIAGPQGVGKTTVTCQLVFGRLGLLDEVLGWPVQVGKRRLLYLAMDRPQQIARAFERIAREEHREVLADRMTVWPGPPPFDFAKNPRALANMAEQYDADTVVLDSLKDTVPDLSDGATGAGLNTAIQNAIADGVEVLSLHHQRKQQNGAGKPRSLSDVYGSTWITAGAGSVILLWGEAGDPIVELEHLKQPASPIGPLRVEHDHDAGTSSVSRGFELFRYLRNVPKGATAPDTARQWFETATPSDNQVAKARRALQGLVKKGLAYRDEASLGGDGGSSGARYFATAKGTI